MYLSQLAYVFVYDGTCHNRGTQNIKVPVLSEYTALKEGVIARQNLLQKINVIHQGSEAIWESLLEADWVSVIIRYELTPELVSKQFTAIIFEVRWECSKCVLIKR
jgi:hypothetical protein